MKVRVYDSKVDTIDRYALYFPLTKKEKEDYYRLFHQHITGNYLCFSFNEEKEVINRCNWDEWNLRDGYCDNLGKKVKIDTLPKFLQEWINGYEKVYNDTIKYPESEEVNQRWMNYF